MRTAIQQDQDQDLDRLLGAERTRSRLAKYAWWLGAAVGLLLLLAAYAAWKARAASGMPRYETVAVTRGDLHVAVTATGNLQPTNKVDVGSELSGTVEAVLVQENDRVKKDQVLARLDPSMIKQEITQSQANLASAEAKLAQAEATVKEANASLERLREVSRLSGGKVPSKTEMESAEATLARAQADASNDRAAINQAGGALNYNEVRLGKASIRSPIDGVVLSRAVEPGQTVAASLQVVTLFTVAEDLREMELKVDVDEADVGSVKEGQTATFTVDAYPGRQYAAKVKRVAYGSTTKDNVVSYSTVLMVRNNDLSLRPGMTATAAIATAAREEVLLVPNAALRFTPATPDTKQESRGLVASLMPGPPRGGASRSTAAQPKGASQQVWTLRDGRPVAMPVTVGVTDGRLTEITGGDLKEGMQVITESAEMEK
jgi:HlyD family secretion protein